MWLHRQFKESYVQCTKIRDTADHHNNDVDIDRVDDIQERLTAKIHTSEVLDNQDTGMRGFHPPEITSKDRHAIERVYNSA